MPPEIPVPKRNRRKLKIFLAFLIGTALASYVLWTRVSAIVVLRWFVRETGLPVEIRAASWDVTIGRLLRGSIDGLSLDAYYIPLKLPISLDTPVGYVYSRKKRHWSIRLKPVLTVGDFPPMKGRVDLELDKSEGFAIDFKLREKQAFTIETKKNKVSVDAWTLNGRLTPSGSTFALDAKNTQAVTSDGTRVKASALKLDGTLTWLARPPLPFKANVASELTGLEITSGSVFATESMLRPNVAFTFDGKTFQDVDVAVDNPIQLSAKGSFDTEHTEARGAFELRAALDKLVNERLASWLENQVPALHRAKAKGSLKLKGQATYAKGALHATGDVALDAKSIELPSRDIYVDDFTLKAPLSFPGEPEWGRVSFGALEFHSVKLKKVGLDVRLAPREISLSTEDHDGIDRPIHQTVWGGAIDIAELYANVPLSDASKPEFTAAVTGGPFELKMIQSDLCLLPKKPLNGSLSFTYPQVLRDKNSLRMIGDTNVSIFNGAAHIGDMSMVFAGENPKLQFDLDWSDLDLHAIGEYTAFGDMRGSLEGQLANTTMAITPIGPIPLSYDLILRGRERGGNKVRFYGRAMDNILAMLGSPQDQIGVAGKFLRVATLWRNWMPAQVEYAGFRAKSDGEWTELSTFDPPGSKKHYLLFGTAFTIPLNTHDVYPVLMKTDAFHGWLAGMIEYFKGRMKNEKKSSDETDCTPLW